MGLDEDQVGEYPTIAAIAIWICLKINIVPKHCHLNGENDEAMKLGVTKFQTT